MDDGHFERIGRIASRTGFKIEFEIRNRSIVSSSERRNYGKLLKKFFNNQHNFFLSDAENWKRSQRSKHVREIHEGTAVEQSCEIGKADNAIAYGSVACAARSVVGRFGNVASAGNGCADGR